MADISAVKPKDRWVDVKHPGTGEAIGLSWGLMSIDDDRMRAIKRKITDKKQTLELKGKTFKAEEIEQNLTEMVFRASIGWKWGLDADGDKATFHGEQPEFDRAAVFAVLTELSWVEDFLAAEISSTKDFFGNSKAT